MSVNNKANECQHSYKSKYCAQWTRTLETRKGSQKQRTAFLRCHLSKRKNRWSNVHASMQVGTRNVCGNADWEGSGPNNGAVCLLFCWFCFVTISQVAKGGLQLTVCLRITFLPPPPGVYQHRQFYGVWGLSFSVALSHISGQRFPSSPL